MHLHPATQSIAATLLSLERSLRGPPQATASATLLPGATTTPQALVLRPRFLVASRWVECDVATAPVRSFAKFSLVWISFPEALLLELENGARSTTGQPRDVVRAAVVVMLP